MAKSQDQVETEETDFMDFDTVEIDEDILTLIKLSDPTADKIIFTVFLINIMLTSFLIGYVPGLFYIWHTLEVIILISYRWYTYKQSRQHYFLFDFCYFANFLLLIYLWLPWTPNGMFPGIFVLTNGPLLWSVLLTRSSVVPHSVDKMTSLFIHMSPAFTTWGTRWFSTPEQKFVLCSEQIEPGPRGCGHVSWQELVLWPVVYYLVWLILYVLVVMIWRRQKVIEQDYMTMLRFVERSKKSFIFKLCNMFGTKYFGLLFFIWQTVFVFTSIITSSISFHWKEGQILLCLLVSFVGCYNGATFYIDVFGPDYYIQNRKKLIK